MNLINAKTLHPYEDFDACARILDSKRLGQTRKNNIVLMRFLRDGTYIGQPSVEMWRPHAYWLMRYAVAIIAEWNRRGFKQGAAWSHTIEIFSELPISMQQSSVRPEWLSRPDLHLSHQSNLIRREMLEEEKCIAAGKTPPSYINHYRDAFPGVPPNLEYVWPTMKN